MQWNENNSQQYNKNNGDFNMNESTMKIVESLQKIFSDTSVDEIAKNEAISRMQLALKIALAEEKLRIVSEYDKHYLQLMREYKEEIQFSCTLQEEIRKERAKFFSETLSAVSKTLKDSDVDSMVASKWLEELVHSYTRSLDLSQDLVKENVMDVIGSLRKNSKEVLSDAQIFNKIDD